MTPLTAHFTLEEMIESDYAIRHGLYNWPPPHALANLARLADAMELVRTVLRDNPIFITSGFRSALVNKGAGGSPHSQHLDGQAADFKCPEFGKPKDICAEIVLAGLPFDQLICEGAWVHYSIAAEGEGNRRQILTGHFKGGKPTYTLGLDA